MKLPALIRSVLFCAAFAAVLFGCGARISPQKSAEDTPLPAVSQESSAAQPTEPEPTGLAAVVTACAPIVGSFPSPGDGGYYLPTKAEYQMLLDAVGTLGVPAVCYNLDPVNTKAVHRFWEEAQAGENSAVTIYMILNFAVYEEVFRFADGKYFRTTTVWNYASDEPEEPFPTDQLDSFQVTESGYLIYKENPEDFMNGAGSGFRVDPLGNENRALYQKYVQPVDTMVLGVIDRNWSKDDFSGIDWEFTYECLYQVFNQSHFSEVYTTADSSSLPYCKIPAADVESFLQQYFPVSAEELHKMKSYDAQSQTYLFTGFLGGGYSPTVEVIKKVNNTDGSFTLTIQFAALEFGRDCDATSWLTVMPSKDGGFQYLGNQTDSPRGNDPNFHDRPNS